MNFELDKVVLMMMMMCMIRKMTNQNFLSLQKVTVPPAGGWPPARHCPGPDIAGPAVGGWDHPGGGAQGPAPGRTGR